MQTEDHVNELYHYGGPVTDGVIPGALDGK